MGGKKEKNKKRFSYWNFMEDLLKNQQLVKLVLKF